MSASREKMNQPNSSDKRSNLMYTIIAVVFVIVAVIAVIWRANVIPKMATAATIDGVDYKVNEVEFFYKNTVNNFMSQNYQMLGMMGVDVNSPLEHQVVTEGVASLMGIEAGKTWKEYFMGETMEHMASVQAVLKTAEEEGFTYPDSVQADYDETMKNLEDSAKASGMSVNKFLQNQVSRTMTEKVYGEQVMRTLQYGAYLDDYIQGLTYTDDELLAEYKANQKNYDKVSFEAITVSGIPAPAEDAEGQETEPTEEELETAKADAKAAAEAMLESYKSGSELKTLADGNDKASYSSSEKAAYHEGDPTAEWLFADERKAGDSTVLENNGNFTLLVFEKRFREDKNTIDIRHILITPETGTLTNTDEGYDEEQETLKAAAHAKAEEILGQWTDGEATEDSFAQLAKENSADSNAAQGGIYEKVAQGDMVESFDAWCFDANRKSGDTGVVDTDFGSHVMYFVGTNVPKWQADVNAVLSDKAFNEWVGEFGADYTNEIHSLGAKFVA